MALFHIFAAVALALLSSAVAIVVLLTWDISWLIQWIVNSFLHSVVTNFECSRLCLFPFDICDLDAAIELKKADLRVLIKWDRLEVKYYGWGALAEGKKVIGVVFLGFDVTVSGITFEDILGVSPKKLQSLRASIGIDKELIPMNKMQCTCMAAVDFKFIDAKFKFHFKHPENLVTVCTAQEMHMYCASGPTQVVDAHLVITSGSVLVLDDAALVIDFYCGRGDATVQLLSSALDMNASASFPLKNFVEVDIQPFLKFFNNYQIGDDDSIEAKITHGLSGAGKMKLIQVAMPIGVHVLVHDNRAPVPIAMNVYGIDVALTSQVSKIADVPSTKIMSVVVQGVDFVGLQSSVYDVNVTIEKIVRNVGDHIDNENMSVSVGDVRFHKVDPLFLNWLCVLQHTSDKIPSSRFSHPKHSSMSVTVKSAYFTSGYSDAETDSWQGCYVDGITVGKTSEAGNPLSTFTIGIDKLNLRTEYSPFNMLQRYAFKMSINGYRYGFIYNFDNMKIVFDLAENLDIKLVAADSFKFSHSIRSGLTPIVMPVAVEPKALKSKAEIIALEQIRPIDNSALDEELLSASPGVMFFLCNGFAYRCPASDKTEIVMDTVDSTLGLLTYMKMMYSISETRAFVSRSVDGLLKAKLYVSTHLSFDPRDRRCRSAKVVPFIAPPSNPSPPKTSSYRFLVRSRVMEIRIPLSSISGTAVAVTDFVSAAESNRCIIDSHIHKIICRGGNEISQRMHMLMRFDDFSFENQGINTNVTGWSSLRLTSSAHMSCPFLHITSMTIKSVENPLSTSKTSINMQSFSIRMHPAMHLGLLMDLLLQQRDAYKLASEPAPTESSSINKKDKQNKPPEEMRDAPIHDSVLTMSVAESIKVSFDSLYAGMLHQDFCVIEMKSPNIHMKSSQDSVANNLAVRLLDDEPVQVTAEKKRYLRYGGFNGGDVRASVAQVTLKFLPETNEYVYVKNLTMTGKLLMGTVINSRIAKNLRKTTFSDDFDIPHWFAGLCVHNSAAPTKFFGDVAQACEEFKLNLHPNAGSYMTSWLRTIDTVIPPSTDTSPSLLWYDNIRYWVHGRAELNINKFQVAYSVSGMARNVLNLFVKMHKANIKLSRDTVEMKGREFSINAEILDKYAAPKRNAKFPLRKHSMRSQLFLIPSLEVSFSHKRKDFMLPDRQYYSHHDVYMNPANPELKDRFYHYRTRRDSIIWAVYAKCSCLRKRDQNVSFFGRMDVMLRVIDILQRPAKDSEEHVEASPDIGRASPVQNSANIATSRPFASPEVVSYPEERSTASSKHSGGSAGGHEHIAVSPEVAFSLVDAAHTLVVYASIDNFMACSWPSAHNLSGIVFSQDGFQLQMKMERGLPDASKMDNSIGSLDIQTLHVELDRLEIYVRNWALFDSLDRESKSLGAGHESKQSSKVHNHSALFHSDEFESVPRVRYMYRPINKLMHTTKVIMFLRPDDESGATVNTSAADKLRQSTGFGSSSVRESTPFLGDPDRMWWDLRNLRLSQGRISAPSSSVINSSTSHIDKRGSTVKSIIGSPSNMSNFGSVISGRSRKSEFSYVRQGIPVKSAAEVSQYRGGRNNLIGMLDFSRTHALVHPPPSALPQSYRKRVVYEHSNNLLTDMVVQTDRYNIDSYSSLYAWSAAKRNSAASSHTKTNKTLSTSDKIWNLKVVDMRLLWTVRLRDLLADYVSHYYEIKMYQDAMFAGTKAESEERERLESEKQAVRAMQRRNSRASASDFLDLAESPAIGGANSLSPVPVQMIGRTRSYSEVDGLGRGRVSSAAVEESDLEKLFLSNAKEEPKAGVSESRSDRQKSSGAMSSRRKSDAMKLAEMFQLESNESETVNEHDPALQSAVGAIRRRNSNFAGVQVPAPAKSSKSRSQVVPRRQSLLYRDIQRSASTAAVDIGADIGNSGSGDAFEVNIDDAESANQANNRRRSAGSIRRSSMSPLPMLREDQDDENTPRPAQTPDRFADSGLVNYKFASNEEITFGFDDDASELSRENGDSMNFRPKRSSFGSRTPMTPFSELTVSPVNTMADGGTRKQLKHSSSAPVVDDYSPGVSPPKPSSRRGSAPTSSSQASASSRRYFIVELIDPQVNFLDERAQGSLLIVAGLSSLEGTKGITAAIQIQSVDDTPQRENTLNLIMDGVSAFTVPTNDTLTKRNSDGTVVTVAVENIVHWKAMDFTMSTANKASHSLLHPTRKQPQVSSRLRSKALQRFSQSKSMAMSHASSLGIAIGEDGKERLVNNLMVAIEDFQIKALYTFYEDVPLEEASTMKIMKGKRALVNLFMLDLPSLILDMTSTQFYIFLNVITNVLLAPPPKTSSSWRESKAADEKDATKKEMKVISLTDFDDVVATPAAKGPVLLTMDNRTHRDGILRALEGHLIGSGGGLDEVDYSLARHIEYFVGRGVWRLRSSGPNDASFASISTAVTATLVDTSAQTAKVVVSNKDMIEVGFMGLFGAHTFHEDRCSTNIFEVQRFWARNVDSSCLHSEGDAATNSSAEVKSSLLMSTTKTSAKASMTSDWVIVPHLLHADPCTRCGRIFSVEHNTSDSCSFHADTEGRPGEFKFTAVGSGRSMRYVQMWSCCGATEPDAVGCSRRPHVCKEIMLTIRAEATPTVLVENVEVTVLKTIEISVFPGALYDIRLQITRNVVDLLHKYFSLKAELLEDDPKADEKTKDTTAPEASVAEATEGDRVVEAKAEETNSTSTSAIVVADAPIVKKHESAIYIKYLRVGEINVEVSTSGFPINLERYKAIVEPYVRHSKVMDWQRLIWKLEKHATWSVTKHTASKGFANMWKVIFPTAAEALGAKQRDAEDDPNNIVEYVNEDNAGEDARAALLLGIKKNKLFI